MKMSNSWKPLHVEFHKEDAKEDIDKIQRMFHDWDYLEFVDDLAHIVNHPDLTDMQKLESLTMMINKQHELTFRNK